MEEGTNREKQDLSRIQGFSDGVFAFAITLLVLSFDVPQIPADLVATELPKQIYAQYPTLISYAISFFAIGGFWYSHHQKFNYIKRYDQVFVWLNLLILMSVCLLPFTTNLVGDYSNSTFAVNLYALSMMMTSLFFTLLWGYATYRHRLVEKDMTANDIKLGYSTTGIIFVIFALSMLFSLIHVDVAKYAWIFILLIPIAFKIKNRT